MHRFSLMSAAAAALVLTACVNDPKVEATTPVPEGSYAQEAQSAGCDFGPGTCALDAANHRMHADMAVEWTGNADVDFLRAMIPHHVGAVEMAQAVIDHGHDPQVRELAESIVRTQEQEIAQMEGLLRALDTETPASDRDSTAVDHHNHH